MPDHMFSAFFCRHWDTFYSRDDLVKLYNSGISHIRVPVGYWLVDVSADEPFPPPPTDDTQGQRKYLKRFMQWCDEIGLKVLVDLHGAPGSQNGFDNSGRRGPINWIPEDTLDETNVERTIVILEKLIDLVNGWVQAGDIRQETWWGLEILNEPAGFFQWVWDECDQSFYPNAFERLRPRLPASVKFVIEHAFREPLDFVDYWNDGAHDNIGLDLHEYHAFGDYWNGLAERPEGWGTNLQASCDYAQKVIPQVTNKKCQLHVCTFLNMISL
jgi:glucan 1,3-beta-glucosidase